MATFDPQITEEGLTQTILEHWRQFHPARLRGNASSDHQAALEVARETLDQARTYVEKLAYSSVEAMSEAMREIALQ